VNLFRALIGIVVTIGLAFLLGWTRHLKSRAAYVYTWIGAILLLLIIRWCL
jgi:hypothetical protein